ncbi:MAG: hypothetical protein V4613_00275 [Bacteroidota bacterium]
MMNDFKVYNNFYAAKLWILTLVITPLLFIGQNMLTHAASALNFHDFGGFFEVYSFFVLISMPFSLPVCVGALGLYWILIDLGITIKVVKIIMISIIVLGIFITFYLMSNTFEWYFSSLYSGVVIVVGLLLKVSPRNQD